MNSVIQKFDDVPDSLNKLSGEVVDCAFQVHSKLGAGYTENIYEEAMLIELGKKGLLFEQQKQIKVPYDEVFLKSEFRLDLLVENKIIVELKAVAKVLPVHQSQIYSYLKATQCDLGLLINFNVPLIKDGIGRYKLRNSDTPR